ncbi:MAG: Rossmann-like and DUF2520 domain-containing protein [Planctomycetota bacterium]
MSDTLFDASQPIGLVGAGALAHAFAATCAAQNPGHPVAVWARSASQAVRMRDAVARSLDPQPDSDPVQLLDGIDECSELATILLAVRDADLEEVAAELAQHPADRDDAVVLHASGALGPEVLAPLEAAGYHVARMHPLVSLRRKADVRAFRGVGFSVAGSGLARERARGLAQWLGGWVLPELETDHARVAYHAAASLLAGGCGVLFEYSLDGMARALGDRDAARRGLIQLLRSVATNLEEVEPRDALTGPSARGDVEVVRAHLEALTPEGAQLYSALLPAMLDMAFERGSLKEADRDRMLAFLATARVG